MSWDGKWLHAVHVRVKVANTKCTTYLVSADDHALDAHSLVDGSGGHEGNDSGAVGVGDDAALPSLQTANVLWVHLRNDQWHSLCHPEGGAVVYNLTCTYASDFLHRST